MIKAANLTCIDESEKPVISDVSFAIHKNDRVAILSRDSELSTLLCHALAGILNRTHPAYQVSGSILYAGEPIEEIDSHERSSKIAYVPPFADLLISGVKDTVFGEVALSLELTGMEPDLISVKVSHILHRLAIHKLSDRDPDELSGGERHKVALAAMIVRAPDVLILDNPSMFLDTAGVNNLLSILRDYDGTIIIADPNPYIWAAIAGRFINIEKAGILVYDTPASLIHAIEKDAVQIDVPAWQKLLSILRLSLKVEKEATSFRSLFSLRTLSRHVQ
jgi:energy-coupling factor transporter ATP-binding protein EcfA2